MRLKFVEPSKPETPMDYAVKLESIRERIGLAMLRLPVDVYDLLDARAERLCKAVRGVEHDLEAWAFRPDPMPLGVLEHARETVATCEALLESMEASASGETVN